MISRLILTTILFFSSFFVHAAITVTQTRLPAGRGDTDQRILLINITSVSGTLNRITINMNGSTAITDVSNIKIYSSGTGNRFFATKTLFGSVSPAAGDLNIDGSFVLNNTTNNYFWLVYDVVAGAAEGNILDATLVSYRRNPTSVTNVNNAPAGSSAILLANKVIFKSNDIVTNSGVPTASQYFRIPAIITAANGDLVTATDARFGSSGDLPLEANIIIRRSTDNGATWLPQQTIADYGAEGAGDASLILDKTNGNIICLFASHNGLVASTPADPIRLNITKSTDNGATWSAPVNITDQVYGNGCSNPTTKNWYAVWASAGRHTQLSSGRLVVAVGVSPTSSFSLSNTIIYSDDGGTTWTPITTLTNPGAGDESHIVQLNNGNLIMSSRINVNGARKFRVSTNGGAAWGAQSSWTQINDSRCNGDFIRYSSTTTGDNMNILLHTIPDNTTSTRQNLTVFASQDEGGTWPVKKTIFPGLAQYSSITRLKDGTIGIYYEMAEPGNPFEMYFARFSLNWLGISGFITLPVNLTNFTVNVRDKQSVLNWNTLSEENFSGYQIEHSIDGINFNKIGFVASKNSDQETAYSFTDKFPVTGKNYYRLKMLDIDGKFSYSKILTALIAEEKTNSVAISPNPFSDRIAIKLTGYTGDKKYIASVIDAMGNVVIKVQLNSSSTDIITTKLSRGTYYIRVIDKNEELISIHSVLKQ